jgi:hypothetical protein
MRPKHFTHEGAQEYGYTPRSGEAGGTSSKDFFRSYTGRKQRKFGHTLPLVYTGELREMSKTANIQPTASGVHVALSRANKANWHNPNSQIDMRDELTRVSDEEAKLLAEVHAETTERLLAKICTIQTNFYGMNASPTTSVAGFFHGE